MRRAWFAIVASGAVAAMLLGAGAGAEDVTPPIERTGPAIILKPPPDAEVAETPAVPVPIARKKPTPPKKASAPKPSQQKSAVSNAPAKKAPAKKAPVKAAAPPQQQAKSCDYCYGCASLSHICRRTWVCGSRYSELLAAGFCRR